MIKEKIWAGKEINTPAGYAVVRSYNMSIVKLIEYVINENGDEEESGTRYLTLNEIAHIMQKTDKEGQTYKVSFLKSDYMSYTDSDFEDVLKGEYKIFCSNYEDADIQSFIDYIGYQEWMDGLIYAKGLGEELDTTSDVHCKVIGDYIREVLSQ